MSELIIEKVVTKNGEFNKVTCPSGHYITPFKDGDDIKSFYASLSIFCPVKIDIENTYRCITLEDYEKLNALKEEAEKIDNQKID